MLRASLNPRLRSAGLVGLVVLATVLVGTVGWVMLSEEAVLDPDEVFPDLVIVDPAKRPEFIFPESVRTYDLSLNRFVDRFARVCMEGKYADFRLMLSNRAGTRIVARRFESMFNALKQVRILALEKLPPIPGVDGPVYMMLAEYDLEDYAVTKGKPTERRRLAVAKEAGQWRIGPVPQEALARLQAYRQSASQPASSPNAKVSATSEDVDASVPRAAANRAARID